MLGVLAAGVLAVASCTPVPGIENLLGDAARRVIWIGEMHGTAQQPILFGDIVCAATKTGRPVIVLLERTRSEQPAWDQFLASNGGGEAKEKLSHSPGWTLALQDGRSSKAMLDLAERLREYKAASLIAGVDLIIDDNQQYSTSDAYEARMAALVSNAAAASPSALVLVYSGNAHARQSTVSYGGETYREAAAHLPPGSVVSVNLSGDAGTTWACEETTCGPQSYAPLGPHHPRGLTRADISAGYDAVIYTGTATTASPPAALPPIAERFPSS